MFYRKKVLVNQATITYVYTVHNLHTLVSVLQNWFTELRPSELTLMNHVDQSQGSKCVTGQESLTHTHKHRPNVEDPQHFVLWVLKMKKTFLPVNLQCLKQRTKHQYG
jgi:hypothetical protein